MGFWSNSQIIGTKCCRGSSDAGNMSPMSIIVIAERFGMNKIYKFGDPCGMRREIFMWEKASIKIGNTDTFSKKTMLMGKISMDLF